PVVNGVILAIIVGLAMAWVMRRAADETAAVVSAQRLGGLLGGVGALVAEVILHDLTRSLEGLIPPAGAALFNASLLSVICAPICLWVLWLAQRGALHESPAAVDFVSPHPTMRMAMLAALAFIAIIFVTSQAGSLYADVVRLGDAETTSAASRQRMLSQMVGRLAYGLAQAPETRLEAQATRLNETLQRLQEEASRLHERIVADSSNHRGAVHPAFAAIERVAVERAVLVESATALLRTTAILNGPPPAFAVDRLQSAVDRFLPAADEAVAALNAHANRNVVDRIARTGVLLIAMPLLLLLAATGIVMPIARMVARQHAANTIFMGDLEMNKSLLEQQASDTVAMAEELALNQAELEASRRQADHIANHDHLTGLPNRRAFQSELKDRLARAAELGRPVALMFIDLDKFKSINDTLGHEAGDDLLRNVAEQLRGTLREKDFAARMGGDEFAIVTDATSGLTHEIAIRIAERIRIRLQFPIETPGGTIPIGATIGVALYPEDGADATALVVTADHIMYEGKRRGRNRVVSAADPALKAAVPTPAAAPSKEASPDVSA
ncbi:MAG: diguanylate cyclase, partial [Alphaproteobacteria bacterium]|nr:diguanylate cyclase [Alphaproteobacteria bacterium]